MKTRLDEGGTERCELDALSPRDGIKLARRKRRDLYVEHATFGSLTFGKARVPTSWYAVQYKQRNMQGRLTALWRHCTHALAYASVAQPLLPSPTSVTHLKVACSARGRAHGAAAPTLVGTRRRTRR